MRLQLVETLRQAMQMRVLRNSCREHLTNHRDHIGIYQQCVWYFERYREAKRTGTYRAYLLYNERELPVGYGALSLDEEALLVTECVGPRFRRQGYGRLLLEHLIRIAASENRNVVADIWATNERSIALHERAGFKAVSSNLKDERELRRYALATEVVPVQTTGVVERSRVVA